MASIHPFAVVSPKAELGQDVEIGPFCTVEADVVIGDGCTLAGRVTIKSGCTLGPDNQLHEGTVIGGLAQHIKPPGPAGGVVIGHGNVFRENTTVHRSIYADKMTVVGNENFFMVGAHIAHDCVVGNRVILANNATLAGHVTVDDQAFISGLVAVHQHCRVGRNTMVGGCARVTRDVLPFVMICGETHRVVGLNLVGLKRSGMPSPEIAELKRAYRLLFHSRESMQKLLADLDVHFTSGPASEFAPFIRASKRGYTPERRELATTVKISPEPEPASDPEHVLRVKAG